VTLPPFIPAIPQADAPAGIGYVYDSSVAVGYVAVVTLTSNTQVAYWPPNTGAVNYLGQVVMTAALASGDIVAGSIMYEATA